jgi:hypothetical protein
MKNMGWITVYIKGKSGFEEEVLDRLNGSDVPFMPGTSYEKGLMLCWIPDTASLRSFKQEIGSKIVFKYRLRFYLTVEAFIEEGHNNRPDPEIVPEEQA